MKWFKHDSNANTDAKLQKILIKHGAQGYGLYWYCLECIAGNITEHNLTFELEHDSEILGHHLKMDSRLVEDILTDMSKLGLFENNNGVITCLKIAKRLDQSMTSNTHMRKMISDWKESHDKVMTLSDVPMQDKSRVDKSIKDKSSVKTDNRVPASDIVDLYHKMLPNLPQVKKLTDTRRGYIKQRWKEDMPSLTNWENFFEYVSQSDFLMGRVEGRNGNKPFYASLEWMTKPANFAKIYEGNYHGV